MAHKPAHRIHTKLISEIFFEVRDAQTEQEKIAILRENDCATLRNLLWMAYSDKVESDYKKAGDLPMYTVDNKPIGFSPQNLYKISYHLTYILPSFPKTYITNKKLRDRKLKILMETIHWTETSIVESIVLRRPLTFVSKELALAAFPDLMKKDAELSPVVVSPTETPK